MGLIFFLENMLKADSPQNHKSKDLWSAPQSLWWLRLKGISMLKEGKTSLNNFACQNVIGGILTRLLLYFLTSHKNLQTLGLSLKVRKRSQNASKSGVWRGLFWVFWVRKISLTKYFALLFLVRNIKDKSFELFKV